METLSCSNNIYALTEIKEAMRRCIRELPVETFLIDPETKILRFELSIEPIHILYWLHNQKSDAKIYWSGRDDVFEIGGIGMADCLKGEGSVDHTKIFTHIKEHLSASHPYLRYYGGMSFDPSCQDREWKDFGSYQFIVPQFEIFRSQIQTTFAVNIQVATINRENIEQILCQLDRFDFSPETTYRPPPKVVRRTDLPDKKGWNALFDAVDQNIKKRAYEKVVLARRSIFDFDVSIRSCALMKHLKETTPDCFHFCFQPSAETAFLGATPERLYRREARNIVSEAIAGTRPRGENEALDKKLEAQLLNSPKDAHEHQYVVDMIQSQFGLFCHQVKTDASYALRKWKGSQHLRTSFVGLLKEDTCDEDILKALHPTPAVGGTPTITAIKVIRESEPFGRGWYAGPVGYIGYDTVEFAVAIRSGLINKNRLSLYAGAGIVSGSTADEEWDEIENKIETFINVFQSKP